MEGENNFFIYLLLLFLNIQANTNIFVEILPHLPPKEICNIRSAFKSLEFLIKSQNLLPNISLVARRCSTILLGFTKASPLMIHQWNHGVTTTFNQLITFHPIRGVYFYEPMFILIQICACGLPSLSYLRNNNFNPVKVIDYYNGLLLLYHYNSVKFIKSYIICNSLTK